MDERLQVIMISCSLMFLLYIIFMIRSKRIELKYSLIWMLTALSLILLSIFPFILELFSGILNIIEPVNTLFLVVVFLIILIAFSLTIAISRSSLRIKAIAQELGILKLEMENFKKDVINKS